MLMLMPTTKQYRYESLIFLLKLYYKLEIK